MKYSDTPPTITRDSVEGDANYEPPSFPLPPFKRFQHNPILRPNPANQFEEGYLYNPTALVIDGKVLLLYRAQDFNLLSSIGLAWSDDGYNFTRLSWPIIHATEPWEQGGGCEDPRVTRIDGVFYLTYTAYDKQTPRLCLATSHDLVNWQKHSPLFPQIRDVVTSHFTHRLQIREGASKAGVIFPVPDTQGKWRMIWGESTFMVASSDDLTHWTTQDYNHRYAEGVHGWENRLIEPGPQPIQTKDGLWLLIYNGATLGYDQLPPNAYSVGQMLVDLNDLTSPIARGDRPLLTPTEDNEKSGLVDNVCFCEGLVQFKGEWLLYFGQADSELAVATAPVS